MSGSFQAASSLATRRARVRCDGGPSGFTSRPSGSRCSPSRSSSSLSIGSTLGGRAARFSLSSRASESRALSDMPLHSPPAGIRWATE
eukprot:5442997-Prymnesium_polylepis.1